MKITIQTPIKMTIETNYFEIENLAVRFKYQTHTLQEWMDFGYNNLHICDDNEEKISDYYDNNGENLNAIKKLDKNQLYDMFYQDIDGDGYSTIYIKPCKE